MDEERLFDCLSVVLFYINQFTLNMTNGQTLFDLVERLHLMTSNNK